ncbi:MAG: ATP-dependent Clp protease proteolytic subunit [Clostridia bacterium]
MQNENENMGLTINSLLENGVILLNGEINAGSAQVVVCQLLYLANKYPKRPIQMFINSPGGEVCAGMAIYDAINYVKVEVQTIAIGMAASMAALLLSSGTRKKRCALPNTEITIHQPLGGASGQASDIIIAAKHIENTKNRLNMIMAKNTGKSVEQISIDTDRDNTMLADDALKYGLIDEVIETMPKAWMEG